MATAVTLLRAGWVAKGVLYVVVGVLAAQVAAGGAPERADQQGALRAVRDQPFGTALLVLLAVGLAAYALWRFVEAWSEDGLERAGHVVSGAAHAVLAVLAFRLAFGSDAGGGDQARTATARLLEAPAGRWLVGAVGLALAGVGVKFVADGLRRSFLDELRGDAPAIVEPLGVVGNVARGAVFVLLGWFVVRAAVEYDPNEARGLDAALHTLAGKPYGPLLLLAVAVGFVAYGAFAALSAPSRKEPA